MQTVAITGGTGLIGTYLSKKLLEKGYAVIVLSRHAKHNSTFQSSVFDVEHNNIDVSAILSANYIIHLAGANIGEKRWTETRKKEIIDSRVSVSSVIFDIISHNPNSLQAFISASAIGYYGAVSNQKIYTESDTNCNDFLGETCKKWEQSADAFQDIGIRTVQLRTGIVLTKNGGALRKMKLPILLGLGSPIGNGKQYMPWIHIEDLCNMYIKAIEDTSMKGAFNAVAPEHITNTYCMKTLSEVYAKPFWFPNVPSVFFKIVYGKMSEMILQGSRVSSEKIQTFGFSFAFPNFKQALLHLKD